MSKGSASANLPLARVRTIMKSSPEVETVSQESLYLITRATVRIQMSCHADIKTSSLLFF